MDLDALAVSARNRGLKLVRSRVRTEGKTGFGKVGLTDRAGEPLFGMEGKVPGAEPEEVQSYLRELEVADWGASLTEAEKKTVRRMARTPSNDTGRPGATAVKAPADSPKPVVRAATAKDASSLLPLLKLLGYSLEEKAFRKRLTEMIEAGFAPLVAAIGKDVVGLCGVQVSAMLQREKPVGRITVLVVAEEQRGKSVGRMLVDAAEAQFRSAGCELLEVTSNDRHLGAHAFYRRVGFERTSLRFAKPL